jgi:hypothetical protein
MTPTPDTALAARLADAGKFATSGKWGQYSPRFMDEAKDAEPKDWDTSHNTSAVHGDERKRLAEWKHADDAAFAEMLVNAYRSGQLITLADHEAAVQAAVAKVMMMCINLIQKERDDYKASPAPKGEWAEHYDDGLSDAIIVISRLDFAAAIRASKGDAL